MIDEYEIKLQQKHRMFSSVQDKENQDRRGIQRRNDVSTRRKLQDRRQEQLQVEIERRKEQRRIAERRSHEDRRVTSDYSQQRLEEEREKLKARRSSDRAFSMLVLSFFGILGLFIYLMVNLI